MISEAPEVSTETHPKARKDHQCCECNRGIRRGESYYRFSGIWNDSGPATYKTCERCQKLRDLGVARYTTGFDEENWPAFGCLRGWISDNQDVWGRRARRNSDKRQKPWPS